MLTTVEVGLPMAAVAGACSVVLGSLSAGPGAWRWGVLASVMWVPFVFSLDTPLGRRAAPS